MSNTAISVLGQQQPASYGDMLRPKTIGEAMDLAKMLAASDMVPRDYKGKAGNIIAAVQMGAELGLAPMQSLQNIAVINGRPSVWGDALLALVQAHPDFEWIQERFEGDGDSRAAVCEVKRKGNPKPIVSRFSVADAKRASLWGKQGPWSQYPDRMLKMRSRGFACRDAFADALRGLSSAEEVRDIPSERSEVVMQAQFEPEPAATPVPAVATLPDVLAGIAAAKDETALQAVATVAAKLSAVDKAKAKIAYAKRRSEIAKVAPAPTAEEPPHDAITGEVTGDYNYGPPPMSDEESAAASK